MSRFMPDATPNQRLQMLQENAAKVEQRIYQKPLTEDEVTARREKHTDNAIAFGDLEDAKKEALADFKAKMDPIKVESKQLLWEIRTKQAKVDGIVYMIPDFESKMMDTYDSEGELIESRRLRPDEKQGLVSQMKKAI